MTTQTYIDVIDHTSDAGFRAWAGALHQAILDCGLIDPGDSGQADFDTVPRPGTNTYVYRIYRFDDTQQGSAPVFIRIEYGTASQAARPAIQVTVGTGSDGSGNITSPIISNQGISVGNVTPDSGTNYTTRVCVVDGCFWFAQALGSQGGACHAFFSAYRSVGSDGVANGDAIAIIRRGGGAATSPLLSVVYRYQTASTHTMTNGSWCLIAGGLTSSLVGGSAQVFKHYVVLPRVRPVPWLFTVIHSEFGNNTQFQATPVGATQRNYVSLGSEGFQHANNVCALPSSAGQTFALVWE